MDPVESVEPIKLGRMPTSREILSETWRDLSGRWLPLIAVLWIALFCQSVLGAAPKIGLLLSIVLSGPFYVGTSAYTLALSETEKPDWELLIQGFDHTLRNIVAFLLVAFWVVLGTLLLVVPGILWMLSYSQTFFILAEDPDITAQEALHRSKQMMVGHRMELVMLHAWQFLLFLLSALTLFIGLIWLIPYTYACWARFYQAVKKMPVISEA